MGPYLVVVNIPACMSAYKWKMWNTKRLIYFPMNCARNAPIFKLFKAEKRNSFYFLVWYLTWYEKVRLRQEHWLRYPPPCCSITLPQLYWISILDNTTSLSFLAVQDSSIGDIVTEWVSEWGHFWFLWLQSTTELL